MRIYSVFDKVAQKTLCVFASPNDGLAIRENVRSIARLMPLGDAELRFTGYEIDDSTGDFSLSNCTRDVVSWDSYKFPENPIKDSSSNTPNVQKVQ